MLPFSSLDIVTDVLLSQDALPSFSSLPSLLILVIECSAQQLNRKGGISLFCHAQPQRVPALGQSENQHLLCMLEVQTQQAVKACDALMI